MQLAAVGRNEPCPCGSGRKYKKCCQGAKDAAAASAASDLDVEALVDRAIESDDWDPVYEVFDQGFALFDAASPLEHVRFRDHLITSSNPASGELARMCESGWLRRCEREICDVLEHDELSRGERDGLRLMVYMLRRFGAKSPVVESIAELQATERGVRARRLADELTRHGIGSDEVSVDEASVFSWIERERPPLLAFPDWFALRALPVDEAEGWWLSVVAPRVCEICLTRLEATDLTEPRPWLDFATLTLFGELPRLGAQLARVTPALMQTDDERMLYAALTSDVRPRMPGVLDRIIEATEARRDYAGAALLRAAQQYVTKMIKRSD